MNLEAVVWSEFASAALVLIPKNEGMSQNWNVNNRAERAAEYADAMMTEFKKRFP